MLASVIVTANKLLVCGNQIKLEPKLSLLREVDISLMKTENRTKQQNLQTSQISSSLSTILRNACKCKTSLTVVLLCYDFLSHTTWDSS